MRLVFAVLLFATTCFAQDLTVESNGKKWPAAEVQKVYDSGCAVVQREFSNRIVRPRVRLILGAEKNSVTFDRREIKLVKWDPYLFAQGVVMLAFEDLMPVSLRAEMTRRAVLWAESTLDVRSLDK